MFKIEVRGCDGRVVHATVNDPAAVPPVGEFVVMPVFVAQNGYLRKAKQLNDSVPLLYAHLRAAAEEFFLCVLCDSVVRSDSLTPRPECGLNS